MTKFNTVVELHKKLRSREVTALKLVKDSLNYIDQTDDQVKAFLSTMTEKALQDAADIDQRFDAGEELPFLAGIPISIKDNINISGEKTTCSSKILENFVSPFDATVIERCKTEGLIPVGKVNLDEFAMGSSTENSAYFTTKNPWNLDYVPGGSSGGSAASVAAGHVPLSLGSDTGGSIRQPAAFCGVVGLKPTYGRVSRFGLVAFASSLDQIGPFSRTVEDSAHLLEAICGHDKHDATSAQLEVPNFARNLNPDVKGLKIAIPKELFGPEIDDAVKESVYKVLDIYKEQGATVEEVSMSSFKASVATYYVIAPAEASANLARYDGVRYTSRAEDVKNLRDMYTKTRGQYFGREVKRRILVGTFALSSGYYDAYYLKAQKARTIIKNDFDRIFKDYDVVISPTTPTLPFKCGEKVADPLEMYVSDLATIPANMAGIPAMSVPCGFKDGLPIGFQIMGKSFDEQTVLNVGHAYQQVTDFHLNTIGGQS